MRRAVAKIAREGDRNLSDPASFERCLDDHLARKFHAVARQLQVVEGRAREGSESAVGIADARPEKDVEDAGQYRVANVSVLPRHGTRLDASLEAGPHAQVGALDEL